MVLSVAIRYHQAAPDKPAPTTTDNLDRPDQERQACWGKVQNTLEGVREYYHLRYESFIDLSHALFTHLSHMIPRHIDHPTTGSGSTTTSSQQVWVHRELHNKNYFTGRKETWLDISEPYTTADSKKFGALHMKAIFYVITSL